MKGKQFTTVLDEAPAPEPFTALPEDGEGWDHVIDFGAARHADLWLGPDDRFYLEKTNGDGALVEVPLKAAIAYVSWAFNLEGEGCGHELGRFFELCAAAIPGKRVVWQDLLKITE